MLKKSGSTSSSSRVVVIVVVMVVVVVVVKGGTFATLTLLSDLLSAAVMVVMISSVHCIVKLQQETFTDRHTHTRTKRLQETGGLCTCWFWLFSVRFVVALG